ncbi:MAG: Dihydrofolate reductase homolog, partial [uncultured Friedmanniella sp.]
CSNCYECRTSPSQPTATAPAPSRHWNARSATPTPVSSSPGQGPPRAGPTGPNRAARGVWTTTSPATSRTTSAPRSWDATSSDRNEGRGPITPGKGGGVTSRPSTRRSSCSLTTRARRSRWPTPPSTSSAAIRPRCSRRPGPLPKAATCVSAAGPRPSGRFSTPTWSTPCTSPSSRCNSAPAAGSGSDQRNSRTGSPTKRCRAPVVSSTTCSGAT